MTPGNGQRNNAPRGAGPAAPLRRLPLGSVAPRGWLQAQMLRDLEHGYAGRLDQLSPHVSRDLYRQRLAVATGHAGWWDAESRGNWLWGYTMLAHLGNSPCHRSRADDLVADLRATQDDDGYIGIHSVDARFPVGGVENGELWAQSRALMVMLAHHELTGDAASLEAARRAADLTIRQYDDDRPHFGRASTQQDRTGLTHGLCYADALEVLFEITADDRYRRFASWLLQDFDRWQVPFPNDDLAVANLSDPARSLRGHAVHTVEHLRAVAFGAGEDTTRREAALRKLRFSATPSGAVNGDESLHGLPCPDAGYEYCTLTELLFSLGRVAQHSADAALGDWMERLAFNAAQGARTTDGRSLAYLCSDTRLDAVASRPDSYSLLTGRHGRFKLSPTHDDVACCCNPNGTRLLPHYVASMWLGCSDSPGLVAIGYGPSELTTQVDGSRVTVRQCTGYPFEDEVRFIVTVSVAVQMTLWLRRPAWVRSVKVIGADARDEDGWIVIDRHWRDTTSFSVRFDVPVRAEPYPAGEIAVLRGPLQFVQPIAHRVRPIEAGGRTDWLDEELVPADLGDIASATPMFDTSLDDLGLVIERGGGPDADDPWSQPPLRLVRPGLTLLPLGCTALRRADFISR
jgi:DUF1680 family protein